jgi:alpha-tubulin suppressor-like RCC1 family protein
VLRLAPTLFVVFAVFQGCSLVANLGDPKEPAPACVAPSIVQATSIAVGTAHVCAVVSQGPGSSENGEIRCWGSNDQGQLGHDPSQVPLSSQPVEISAGASELTNATTLTLTSGYSCVTTSDGFLVCWGNVAEAEGVSREPATDSYDPSLMDYEASRLVNVGSASVTDSGGCCTKTDRTLLCWGSDVAPESPDGGVVGVDGGADVGSEFDKVTVGAAHACGLVASLVGSGDDVACWGQNDHGQTGLPASGIVSHPNRLGLDAKGPLRDLATGGNVSCALFVDGTLDCWDANDRGQAGQPPGNPVWNATPVCW